MSENSKHIHVGYEQKVEKQFYQELDFQSCYKLQKILLMHADLLVKISLFYWRLRVWLLVVDVVLLQDDQVAMY